MPRRAFDDRIPAHPGYDSTMGTAISTCPALTGASRLVDARKESFGTQRNEDPLRTGDLVHITAA